MKKNTGSKVRKTKSRKNLNYQNRVCRKILGLHPWLCKRPFAIELIINRRFYDSYDMEQDR